MSSETLNTSALRPMARVEDVARLLGLKRDAAYARLRAGDIPGARRIGKVWVAPWPALEALAEGRQA